MQHVCPANHVQREQDSENCEQQRCEEPPAEQGQQQQQGAPPAALEAGSSPQRRPRVLLAASGSVATIKLAQLAELLVQVCVSVPCGASCALTAACCRGDSLLPRLLMFPHAMLHARFPLLPPSPCQRAVVGCHLTISVFTVRPHAHFRCMHLQTPRSPHLGPWAMPCCIQPAFRIKSWAGCRVPPRVVAPVAEAL